MNGMEGMDGMSEERDAEADMEEKKVEALLKKEEVEDFALLSRCIHSSSLSEKLLGIRKALESEREMSSALWKRVQQRATECEVALARLTAAREANAKLVHEADEAKAGMKEWIEKYDKLMSEKDRFVQEAGE